MEVTGISVARAQAIEDASITSGTVDDAGNLVLTNGGGAEFNAGKVIDLDRMWPVNSIYIGVSATNPAVLFGAGDWVRFAEGRVLVSQKAGDADFETLLATGGAKTHTLTAAEMPTHTHAPKVNGNAARAGASGAIVAAGSGVAVTSDGLALTNDNAGGGGAHNNLQPFMVVYMWRRTG